MLCLLNEYWVSKRLLCRAASCSHWLHVPSLEDKSFLTLSAVTRGSVTWQVSQGDHGGFESQAWWLRGTMILASQEMEAGGWWSEASPGQNWSRKG
jgi:hypothetical protein